MREGIGVALSGGGHRASLFGLGALLYLADAGKQTAVRSIASVSGGSLTNGYVAQEVDFRTTSAKAFEERMQPFARRLAEAGTFMDAQLTRRFLLLLGLTLIPAAASVWFLVSLSVTSRVLVSTGLVGAWGLLVLRHAFATRLGQIYGAVLVAGFYLAAVGPWFIDAPSFLRFAVFLITIGVWASTLFGLRGRVWASALRTTLYSRDGQTTKLADIPLDIDHILCATDLQSAEHVYFSGSFVYGYRYGKGTPADLPLSTAVQASAALPGAFPPKWLPTAAFAFRYPANAGPKQEDRPRRMPKHLVLTDGGVYDNMADQWAQGSRIACDPGQGSRRSTTSLKNWSS